ncbi:hypothetical protein [Telmatospirillum sp.]|uniref:hypothetical protein n=1 Tax=Telmatospirillum sp. TaxID=2079197 RepID=UPI002849E4D2|nr:hypothetical protein [Telmatospirillum sp.]MDR3439136.1 hypothetical protein [Telmatospirillum sp.]
MHGLPLEAPAAAPPLLVAAARSHDTVGMSLERRKDDGGWEIIGRAAGRAPHLALARDPDGKTAFRLHVWSMDRTMAPIALRLRAANPSPAGERTLANGVVLTELPGFDPPLGVAAVKLDKPGLFHLDAAPPTLVWSAAAGQALGHGPEMVVAGGTRLWFADSLAAGPVKARRILPDASTALALTLPDGQSAGLPLSVAGSGPVLWIAESRIGQPGISVGSQDAAADGRAMAVGTGVAVALLPDAHGGDEPVVRLWRADGQTGELPLTLRQLAFPKAVQAKLPWGVSDGALGAGAATFYALPAGAKRLQLALPPFTVAALLRDGVVSRAIWSGDQPGGQAVDTSADSLLLLNTGTADGQVSASLSPVVGEEVTLGRGTLLRQWQASAGNRRFDIALAPGDCGKGLLLRVAGAVEEAILVQRDGIVRRGTSLPVTDDAVLVLVHKTGMAAAWLDNGDADAWPAADTLAKAEAPANPGAVSLSGPERQWRFDSKAPTLLHLSTSSPVMIGLRRPVGLPELSVWGQGGALHAFLPGGTTLLGLRPLQDGGLSGTAIIAESEPIAIDEGLGPKIRLAPGDARLFAFDLRQAGPIGVGVRGNADTARVRLLDSDGRTLAEGAVAMTSLAVGRYYLLVENRADGGASELQPALVGAARPDTGPPEDIKRHYWELVATGEDK